VTTTHNHDPQSLHQLGAPPPKSSKSKGPLAAGLVMLACVAACTLPLLLAGGLAAGVSALFTDSDIVAPVILGATGAGAIWWWQRKKSAAKTAAASPGGGSCGCGGGC